MMREIYNQASDVLVHLDEYALDTMVFSSTELHDPLGSLALSAVKDSAISENNSEDWDLVAVKFLHTLASTDEEHIADLPVFAAAQKESVRISEVWFPLLDKLAAWFSSSWWSRVWVVQETMPGQVWLICGSYLVPWSIVAAAAEKLYQNSLRYNSWSITDLSPRAFSILRNLYTHVLEIESARAVRSHGRDLGALEVLWTYRHRKASDDRDHVFALTGLLPGHFVVAGIVPDYGLDTTETFTTVTMKLLRFSRSLDVLVGAWRKGSKEQNLPTWVQDWSYTEPGESHIGLYQFLAMQLSFSANKEGHSWRIIGTLQRQGSVLFLDGIEVDVVDLIGEEMEQHWKERDAKFGATFRNWMRMVESRQDRKEGTPIRIVTAILKRFGAQFTAI